MRRRLVALLLTLAACSGEDRSDRRALSVTDALGRGDVEGYERALEPRALRFPADHGPHPDFRSEWWYLTGNVTAADGRRFGYHVTFFRAATAPSDPTPDGSAWRTRQLWMAHFAVVDPANGAVHTAERFAREALGLAGATASPFAVHVDDWSVRSVRADSFAPLRLRARQDDLALDLELEPRKPPVLQGERGLSRKSRTPGNASYYYSITRMAARGSVRVGDVDVAVEGSGWLDREWSTSALDDDQVGWDWFALQLDDGRDLMFYRMRRADGSSDPMSSGVLVGPDGAPTPLALAGVELEPTRTWRSPRTGAEYPVAFRMTILEHDLVLEVGAIVDDQELDLTFRYWEGAVDVRGRSRGAPVGGRGYLEMTGYADLREGR